ncbi:ankyrin repeat-containing domain protein [Rhexocercosporidium sp. MPI-PUGE-AT-0058]|nr:ankyrin repeat-containing domain protein [Rhexocercosporidium sp. MPI-PUGE-AT-0058]
MTLPDLTPELIDHIFTALLDLIGPLKILRLRVVNQFFDESIVRAVTDSFISRRNGPFHYWLDQWIQPPENRDRFRWSHYRRVSPPMMSRFIEARMKSDNIEPALDPLKQVLQVINDEFPVSELEIRTRALKVYEAAADYLDWDMNHKFAQSWPGTKKRMVLEEVDENKQTLLGAAIIINHISTVQILLGDDKVNINYESPIFGRPLQLAARWGRAELVKSLLSRGADSVAAQVNANALYSADHLQGKVWGVFYSTHGTPLQVAALAGHTRIVQSLLEAQKDILIDQSLSGPSCALMAACRGGSLEVIEVLLAALQNLPPSSKTVMFLTACRQGRLEVVKKMLSMGVPPDVELKQFALGCPRTGLQFAAMRGSTEIVQFLIENTPSLHSPEGIKFQVKPALDLALRRGHLECVQMLYRLGDFSQYPLKSWLTRGAIPHVRLIRHLVELGVDQNQLATGKSTTVGMEALLDAAERNREPVVRALLELGISPNSEDQHNSPVLRARLFGSGDVLRTLLKFGGVDIDLSNSVYATEVKNGKVPYPPRRVEGGCGDRQPSGWRGRDF